MQNQGAYWRTQRILKTKAFRRYIALSKHRTYTRFVILGAPRTGTILLHTYLNSHPHLHSWGEEPRRRVTAGKACTLSGHIYRPQPREIGAGGCKLFYQYRTDVAFRHLMDELVADPQIVVLHLTRKNQLRSYVSLLRAQQSGHWNDRHQQPGERPTVRVVPEAWAAYRAEMAAHQRWVVEALADHRVVEVSYEEMVARPEATLDRVQVELGLSPRRLFTLLVPQNPKPLATWVENYDAVAEWDR